MNALGQGLVVTGPDNRIEYANAAAAEMTGFPAEAAIGRFPEEFVRPEDRVLLADPSTATRRRCYHHHNA